MYSAVDGGYGHGVWASGAPAAVGGRRRSVLTVQSVEAVCRSSCPPLTASCPTHSLLLHYHLQVQCLAAAAAAANWMTLFVDLSHDGRVCSLLLIVSVGSERRCVGRVGESVCWLGRGPATTDNRLEVKKSRVVYQLMTLIKGLMSQH